MPAKRIAPLCCSQITTTNGRSKVIGCGLPARLMGMNTRDSLIVGFGMSPRGEVAMIVALIGLNEDLIAQGTYVALVLMSLLTTIITPILFRNWLFKDRAAERPAKVSEDT